MKKYSSLISLFLIILLLIPFGNIQALDLDVDFFIKLFNIGQDKLDYFADFDMSNEDLSTILYLYSNADRELTKDQFENIDRSKYDWRELSIYFGLPPILFDNEIIKLRRPNRYRMQVPLGETRYKNRYKTNSVEESVNLNPGRYQYYYKNKLNDIEEKIDVKQNKYEYYYKSNYIEEQLSVHMVTNKYEYHYRNLRTGERIKKEGVGKPIKSDRVYNQLREEYYKTDNEENDNEKGLNFQIKFNF
jgi:hypothetical protein